MPLFYPVFFTARLEFLPAIAGTRLIGLCVRIGADIQWQLYFIFLGTYLILFIYILLSILLIHCT